MPPASAPRSPLGAAVFGVLTLAVAPPVWADDSCPVRLIPADADPVWQSAVAQAAERLSHLTAPHDCRAVEVSVGPAGGATMAFLTTDGRGAARSLASPAELSPTLEALLVTRVAPPEPPPPEAPLPSPPPVLPKPPVATAAAPSPANDRAVGWLLAAEVGGRVAGLASRYLAPSFVLQPTLTTGPWEVGAFVEYAPSYAAVSFTPPEGFALSTLTTGVVLGVRHDVGKLALGLGGMMAVQSVSIEADDLPDLSTSRSVDVAQPRLGAYGKVAYPSTSMVRALGVVNADAVLGRLRANATEERRLPGLARFGLGLAVGVEVAIP